MTRAAFAVFAILLAVSIDAKDPECPDISYKGPSVYVPDYYDCHMYYECAEGVKVHMQCPPGLFWDDYLNTCNYPDKTNCAHTAKPTVAPPIASARPTTLGNLCVEKKNGEIVPYPNDCSIFIQCISGIEEYYRCARGAYFDKITERCSSTSPDRC